MTVKIKPERVNTFGAIHLGQSCKKFCWKIIKSLTISYQLQFESVVNIMSNVRKNKSISALFAISYLDKLIPKRVHQISLCKVIKCEKQLKTFVIIEHKIMWFSIYITRVYTYLLSGLLSIELYCEAKVQVIMDEEMNKSSSFILELSSGPKRRKKNKD